MDVSIILTELTAKTLGFSDLWIKFLYLGSLIFWCHCPSDPRRFDRRLRRVIAASPPAGQDQSERSRLVQWEASIRSRDLCWPMRVEYCARLGPGTQTNYRQISFCSPPVVSRVSWCCSGNYLLWLFLRPIRDYLPDSIYHFVGYKTAKVSLVCGASNTSKLFNVTCDCHP